MIAATPRNPVDIRNDSRFDDVIQNVRDLIGGLGSRGDSPSSTTEEVPISSTTNQGFSTSSSVWQDEIGEAKEQTDDDTDQVFGGAIDDPANNDNCEGDCEFTSDDAIVFTSTSANKIEVTTTARGNDQTRATTRGPEVSVTRAPGTVQINLNKPSVRVNDSDFEPINPQEDRDGGVTIMNADAGVEISFSDNTQPVSVKYNFEDESENEIDDSVKVVTEPSTSTTYFTPPAIDSLPMFDVDIFAPTTESVEDNMIPDVAKPAVKDPVDDSNISVEADDTVVSVPTPKTDEPESIIEEQDPQSTTRFIVSTTQLSSSAETTTAPVSSSRSSTTSTSIEATKDKVSPTKDSDSIVIFISTSKPDTSGKTTSSTSINGQQNSIISSLSSSSSSSVTEKYSTTTTKQSTHSSPQHESSDVENKKQDISSAIESRTEPGIESSSTTDSASTTRTKPELSSEVESRTVPGLDILLTPKLSSTTTPEPTATTTKSIVKPNQSTTTLKSITTTTEPRTTTLKQTSSTLDPSNLVTTSLGPITTTLKSINTTPASIRTTLKQTTTTSLPTAELTTAVTKSTSNTLDQKTTQQTVEMNSSQSPQDKLDSKDAEIEEFAI